MGRDTSDRRNPKGGLDKDECRKNRMESDVKLRKSKKEESMMKRRNFAATAPAEEAEATTASPAGAPELPKDVASLGAILSGWVATNGAPEGLANALRATRALRKLLSIPKEPPIDDCIDAGLVPHFVTLLAHPDAQVQFESLWCAAAQFRRAIRTRHSHAQFCAHH